MWRNLRVGVAAVTLTLTASACAAGPGPAPTPAAPPGQTPAEPTDVPSPTPDPEAAIQAALQTAAQQPGVDPSQLRVVRVESREWPDSSLGCPRPGQLYAQIVTPGFVVEVASGDRQLELHTDTRGRAVVCQAR